jgi:mitotic-spindle organizing protein 1
MNGSGARPAGAGAGALQTLDLLHELSKLLNTGLDRETLEVLVALCENGANPEALAMVVKELRREAAALARAAGTPAGAKTATAE